MNVINKLYFDIYTIIVQTTIHDYCVNVTIIILVIYIVIIIIITTVVMLVTLTT